MNKALFFYYFIGIVSALGISFITYFLFNYYNLRLPTWFLCLFPICSVYMLFAQLLKYRSLHFYVDFSHWTQLLYSIATTGKTWSLNVELLVPGAINYLSVHFVPFIYAFAIPFRLWPYSETLIVSNFIVMISAAIPLYKLALTSHQNRRFALFVVVLLLWYPTFQYIVMYEFETLRFSIPIILWMLYFWQKKKMLGYYFFVLLAVLVREEVGLTIMMFGIYLVLIERQHRPGLITVLIGAGAFAVITQIVMPALRGGDGYQHIAMSSFSIFGSSIGEIIINTIKNPLLALETILHPIKLANVFMLFFPLLFIPFLAPAVLIAILANLGVGLLSKSITHISFMLFYISPSIPFIFYAFIKGWPRILAMIEAIIKDKFRISRFTNIHSSAMAAVLSALLIANIFFGPSPISLQFWFKNLRPAPFRTQDFHYSVYKVTDHHRTFNEFYNLIPEAAIVSAPQFLHPRLFKKRGALIFPQLKSFDTTMRAEYALFDKTNNGLKRESPAYLDQNDFNEVEKDTENWKLVKSADGYYLYENLKSDKRPLRSALP